MKTQYRRATRAASHITSQWAPYFRSLLRMAAAISFLTHGSQKLFGWPTSPFPPVSDLLTQMGIAGLLETGGGLLMLVGLFTRPVGFVLAGQMAVAYFQAHAPAGFWPIANGGELASLYCFLWLYFAGAGPGPWSIDAWRVRNAGPSMHGSRR